MPHHTGFCVGWKNSSCSNSAINYDEGCQPCSKARRLSSRAPIAGLKHAESIARGKTTHNRIGILVLPRISPVVNITRHARSCSVISIPGRGEPQRGFYSLAYFCGDEFLLLNYRIAAAVLLTWELLVH
jgi:hypothetical protein